MKYVRYMNSLWDELNNYKAVIDGLCERCRQGNKKLEKEIEQIEKEGMHTPAFVALYRKNGDTAFKLRDEMSKARRKARENVVSNLNLLENEMNQFFKGPVNPEFSAKLSAIHTIGMPLTGLEFERMEEEAFSYMEHRLLRHLAESRKKEEAKMVDGGVKKVPTSDPYTMKHALPDYNAALQTWDEYKNAVLFMLEDYCGVDAVMLKALDNYQDKEEFVVVNADAAVRSDRIFRSLNEVLSAISKVSPKWSVEVPSISQYEKTRLDEVLDPTKAGKRTRQEMQEFAKKYPYSAELAAKDERYMKFFEQEPKYLK